MNIKKTLFIFLAIVVVFSSLSVASADFLDSFNLPNLFPDDHGDINGTIITSSYNWNLNNSSSANTISKHHDYNYHLEIRLNNATSNQLKAINETSNLDIDYDLDNSSIMQTFNYLYDSDFELDGDVLKIDYNEPYSYISATSDSGSAKITGGYISFYIDDEPVYIRF